LLIAIAVIGILMSLLIPAVSKVMENARRAKGSNCLKQIAMAYSQYCNDDVNGRNISGASNGVAWAVELAKGGYLNDSSIYTFAGDSGATKVVKKSIITDEGGDNEAWGNGDVVFSVYLIDSLPMDAPLSTTPIAFTRGLQTNGKWPNNKEDPAKSVYGDKGGYIAFLDGHVEWFDDLGTDGDDGKLMKWGGGSTNDVTKAIPSFARILDGSTVIIREANSAE
jgi:prepilin-type processing-associated H-X9-DG protein